MVDRMIIAKGKNNIDDTSGLDVYTSHLIRASTSAGLKLMNNGVRYFPDLTEILSRTISPQPSVGRSSEISLSLSGEPALLSEIPIRKSRRIKRMK
jgi:hypothetical protein